MVDISDAPAPATTLRAEAESVPPCSTGTSSLESLVSPEESATYEDADAYRNAIEAASRHSWSAGSFGA